MFCFGPFRLWTYVWIICRNSNMLKMRPPSEKNEDPPFATPPLLMRPPSKKNAAPGVAKSRENLKNRGGVARKKPMQHCH